MNKRILGITFTAVCAVALIAVMLVSTTGLPVALAAEEFLPPNFSKLGIKILFEFDEKIEKDGKYKGTDIYKNLNSLKSTAQLSPIFKVNTNMFDNEQLTIPTFDGLITLETVSLEKENKSEFIWSGYDKTTSAYATIVVSGENVAGNIHTQTNLYSIETLGSGYHVLREINTEAFEDEPPSYEKMMGMRSTDWFEIFEQVFTTTPIEITIVDKKIHLMVLYTENVDGLVADIDTKITLALTETNNSHIDSDSDSRYKVVHKQKINYNSIGASEDRDKLLDPNDGDLGFVHDLRDKHGADVVMLITDVPGTGCGIAGKIGANESEGFVVVDYDCMTGYFSFAHELGHIHGARHIISQDSTDEPFEYGHGYCDQDATLNWRTIMGYNCPTGTGGDRQQYWSNPDITINGDVGGTAELQDNSRVHDETFEYVCSFRDPNCYDPIAFQVQVEVLYEDYPFCFDSPPTAGGLPQICTSNFDPCGCGVNGPLCNAMLCAGFSELNEIVVFTQLQEIRPYQLINMGIDSNQILPRDGMVMLDSDVRDRSIRVTAESAKVIINNNDSWHYRDFK